MQRRQFVAAALGSAWVSLNAQTASGRGRPALIPYPRHVDWTAETLDCAVYDWKAPADSTVAVAELQRTLEAAGARRRRGAPLILLRTGDVPNAGAIGAREAYSLEVTAKGVTATAPRPAGLLYAVMTLRQLLVARRGEHPTIAGCRIADWPAYAWRGFMHDVGRNYQEPAILKRFIDVMATYKLNVFHLHLTDSPGYRIECRAYPQLNASASFSPLRAPGKIYTYAELNDLIRYCTDRGIMVVPEIDMPGHSEYFNRSFGFDMQDDRGLKIMLTILDEFMDHVDTPFLHVGSDEVEVQNSKFMEQVASRVRSRGRRILAWHPGNPPSDQFISQVWSYGPGLEAIPGSPIVDSRNNYINHADPFMAPSRLLHSATGGKQEGDAIAWGGTLCHWPDIRVATIMNVYRQSPVFPALLAATENYWCGGKAERPQYWARLPLPKEPEHTAYVEFEARLLEHRDRFFSDWPFPYLRQTDIPWKLIGPFDHGGDVNTQFPPEREILPSFQVGGQEYRWIDALGATIAVNHARYDGWFPRRKSGTVYGLTYIWSPDSRVVGCWIGFNGPSRSSPRHNPNPQQGEWSTAGSKVWVNDSAVPGPVWDRTGPITDQEETPLVDEDYFYRKPTPVQLKAGWNKVLIKAPKADTTYNWLFTFIPVQVTADRVREVPGLRYSATLPAAVTA